MFIGGKIPVLQASRGHRKYFHDFYEQLAMQAVHIWLLFMNIKKQLLFLALALVLTLATLFFPVAVNSEDELKSADFGWPFSFVNQDFSRYDPDAYPQVFYLGGPWENPTYLMWYGFLFSSLVFFSILNIVSLVYFFVLKIL